MTLIYSLLAAVILALFVYLLLALLKPELFP
jgi:K+-transporting ATPase KdpF subunit